MTAVRHRRSVSVLGWAASKRSLIVRTIQVQNGKHRREDVIRRRRDEDQSIPEEQVSNADFNCLSDVLIPSCQQQIQVERHRCIHATRLISTESLSKSESREKVHCRRTWPGGVVRGHDPPVHVDVPFAVHEEHPAPEKSPVELRQALLWMLMAGEHAVGGLTLRDGHNRQYQYFRGIVGRAGRAYLNIIEATSQMTFFTYIQPYLSYSCMVS